MRVSPLLTNIDMVLCMLTCGKSALRHGSRWFGHARHGCLMQQLTILGAETSVCTYALQMWTRVHTSWMRRRCRQSWCARSGRSRLQQKRRAVMRRMGRAVGKLNWLHSRRTLAGSFGLLCFVCTAHLWTVHKRHVHCYADLKQASKRKTLTTQMDDPLWSAWPCSFFCQSSAMRVESIQVQGPKQRARDRRCKVTKRTRQLCNNAARAHATLRSGQHRSLSNWLLDQDSVRVVSSAGGNAARCAASFPWLLLSRGGMPLMSGLQSVAARLNLCFERGLLQSRRQSELSHFCTLCCLSKSIESQRLARLSELSVPQVGVPPSIWEVESPGAASNNRLLAQQQLTVASKVSWAADLHLSVMSIR